MSGHFAYSLITAPAIEPMSVAQAKAHLRLDVGDEDSLVASWIKAARQQVEQDSELKLLTQTWELALDCFPYDMEPINILTGPVQSVTSLKYYDHANVLQTHATTNYTVDVSSIPARIGLTWSGYWPTDLRLFQPGLIRFVAGWTSADQIPEPLIRAMALWIGWFSENREPTPFERSAYDALLGAGGFMYA